jgi:hypothetical protein
MGQQRIKTAKRLCQRRKPPPHSSPKKVSQKGRHKACPYEIFRQRIGVQERPLWPPCPFCDSLPKGEGVETSAFNASRMAYERHGQLK